MLNHPIIEWRYRQYDRFIEELYHRERWHMYREVNITFAEKFYDFYEKTHTLGFKRVHVPRSRLPFIASRKPIGRLGSGKGVYLSPSMSYKHQIDHFYKVLKQEICLSVDEDITFIKNCLVQVANNLGLTTYVELHGALGLKHGFLPLTAKYIKVWDERQKQKLIGWGLEAERIIVEGYAKRYASWEPIKKEIGSPKANLFADLWNKYQVELNAFKPLILIAPYTLSSYGDGGDEINRRTIRFIQEAILDCCERQIIIKLHPGSPDLEFWQNWHKHHALPQNIVVIRDFDSRRLVLASDLMIVHHSTMAIDGWKMGKGVAIIQDGMPSSVEEFGDEFVKVSTKYEIVNLITNHELDKINRDKTRLEMHFR